MSKRCISGFSALQAMARILRDGAKLRHVMPSRLGSTKLLIIFCMGTLACDNYREEVIGDPEAIVDNEIVNMISGVPVPK